MKQTMNGIIKTILISSISFLFIACSNKQTINLKPTWVNNPKSIIGVCGFIPSENISTQKTIAIKKAIAQLIIKKGLASGDVNVKLNSIYTFSDKNEKLNKLTRQNSNIDFWFKNIKYEIKVVDMWKDLQTKELYVRIEEF